MHVLTLHLPTSRLHTRNAHTKLRRRRLYGFLLGQHSTSLCLLVFILRGTEAEQSVIDIMPTVQERLQSRCNNIVKQ